MNNIESAQEKVFTEKEALQEIEIVWQQICQTGNVDSEKDILDQIRNKMSSKLLNPNQAVEEAYKVMDARIER